MEKRLIRNETPDDYAAVEHITREAFWNLHIPGCDEHYLVHLMRTHADFIPELDFVIELDGRVIGNVMYTKTRLVDESGMEKQILTFGPLSIHPDYQRKGYGKILLEHSFTQAIALGYDTIVIFGDPNNYVSRGFKSCKKYNVCLENDVYPCAMLVKELIPGALNNKKWYYYDSPIFQINSADASQFDLTFEPKEKKVLPCQEAFYIMSHSVVQD